MRAMQELDEHADRFGSAPGSMRSDPPQIADTQPDAPGRTADALSVRLVPQDHRQRAAVLDVHGEIDLGTAPVLRDALLPVLEHHAGPVVVDLSEVTFMDSTGVHLLIDTLEQLRPENRRFAIACREGGPVHRVLTLVGLLDAVSVYRSRESAVIGGDDVLRSEPERGGRVFAA
jgi:anti-anti-sigma factor